MRSFIAKSTTSKNKLITEKYLTVTIGKEKRKGLCIGLVGCWKGIERHVKFYKALGFTKKQIVIIEICPRTHASQKKYCAKHHPSIRCVLGNAIDWLKENANKVEYIDFDGVTKFGEFDQQLIKLFKKHKNIKAMNINGSGRGVSLTFINICKENNFRRTRRKKDGWIGFEKKKIVPQLLERWTPKNVETTYQNYKGMNNSNMYLLTLKRGA